MGINIGTFDASKYTPRKNNKQTETQNKYK